MEALSEQSGYEGKTNIEHLTHASKDGTDELNFKPLLHKVTFTEKNIVIPILVYWYQCKYQVLPVLSYKIILFLTISKWSGRGECFITGS